jgi:hypothetical protein
LAHVEFIKTFGIKGVGFSGGGPLLVKERLLSHIKAIRMEFGHSIYVWMYTNGDLADHEALMKLGDAGLNEIRFNLSPREYDLSPVITARKYIPTVTVEMPAIPEDIELVKSLLAEMQSVGIDFLNLHQLSLESQNWRELLERHYHIDCRTGMASMSQRCAPFGCSFMLVKSDYGCPSTIAPVYINLDFRDAARECEEQELFLKVFRRLPRRVLSDRFGFLIRLTRSKISYAD